MLKPDSQKFHFLELIGVSGEFPSDQLNRLFRSSSYSEKVVTDLKNNNLIRVHYKDKLKGYRLTKQGKALLLSSRPECFQYYLTGNVETNIIRSEPPRRLRLHQKAQVYLTLIHAGITFFPDEKPAIFSGNCEAQFSDLQNLSVFYTSRELKELGPVTTKIKNSRSIGILMAPHCVYAIYNTGSTIFKWGYKTEVRFNAFLQYYLRGNPYSGIPHIRAIIFGDSMDTGLKLLTSTGGYKHSLFTLDTSFEHFHFLPNTFEGEILLQLLVNPIMINQLNQLLSSDMDTPQKNIPVEHDAVTKYGIPTLFAYDFDMQRISRFNAGLNIYNLKGNLICFDFQVPVLKQYLTANVHFSSIDLIKFRKEFLFAS